MLAEVRDREVEGTARGTELDGGALLAVFCVRAFELLFSVMEMSASSFSSFFSFTLMLISFCCIGRV